MDDIDGLSILVSFLVSGVGFVLFSYGRKMTRPPQIAGGLLLMVFPYFVSSVAGMLGIAALVILAVAVAVKMGW